MRALKAKEGIPSGDAGVTTSMEDGEAICGGTHIRGAVDILAARKVDIVTAVLHVDKGGGGPSPGVRTHHIK